MTKGPLELVSQVATILDGLGIPYALGGSMASSLVGLSRIPGSSALGVR
jgi:hypothetical protein